MKKPSRTKRLIFSAVALATALLLLELFAFLFFLALNRRTVPRSRYQEERRVLRAAGPVRKKTEDNEISYYDHAFRDWQQIGKVHEVLHPYLGYVRDPEKTPYHSDYGFPGEVPPISPPDEDRVVIGIFGGSFAYGVSRLGGEEFLRELAKSPEYEGKEIVLHTVAMGGYKQPQQLLSLAYFLALGAHFDIVINFDGFNEVALPPTENLPKQVFPFYPRAWFARVRGLSDRKMLMILGEIASLKEKRKRAAALFSTFPFRQSNALNILWKYLDKSLAHKEVMAELALQQYEVSRKEDAGYTATGPPFEYEDRRELYEALADYWKECSIQMGRLCEANGIAYYHFLQPNQRVPDSKIIWRYEAKRALRRGSPYEEAVEIGYPYLIAKGEELLREGVDFYDLTMIFKEIDEPLYIDNCCHVSDKGYRIIGAEMGRLISAGGGEEPPAEIPNHK